MSTIRVIPLGTSSGTPTRERNVSSLAIASNSHWIMFDCGEGTQHRMLVSPLKPRRLEAIFITHLHGDHIFGLPGLLSSMSLQNRTEPLAVHGPPGLRAFVESVLKLAYVHLSYPLEIVEALSGQIRRGQGYSVRCLPLEHRSPDLGYCFEEESRPGRLDLHGSRPGRKIAYCTDTRPTQTAVALANGVDLLIHEATYLDELADLAHERGHSTAADAARVALEAGAKRLLITHFSPRYSNPEMLVREARSIFPECEAARDLSSIEVA